MGQAKRLVVCVQGLARLRPGGLGCVIFLVKHCRPEVEEKASGDMDLELRKADRRGRKAQG